jgi:hypothetical protein
MNKVDLGLIVSQIFVVGSLVVRKEQGMLGFGAIVWLMLTIIAWGMGA